MTWAMLAVMSLFLSGVHQEILSPKMDRTLTIMERAYEKQWVSPMTIGCKSVDSSVESKSVIIIYECPKDTEYFVVYNLVNKSRNRIWNVKNTALSFKTK